ncbi:MAG: S8 family serine peptidase [Calditrichota bacterium]
MTRICPISGVEVDDLVVLVNPDDEHDLIAEVRNFAPEWQPEQGISARLLDHYKVKLMMREGMIPEATRSFPIRSLDERLIPPTPYRMSANPHYTGRGVTICFIDSGFYPHPDLLMPRDRILHIEDITNLGRPRSYFKRVFASSWHGTMTSVSSVGSGYLSNGLYRGIASDANVVLLKTMENGRITGEHIRAAIQWAIDHRNQYNIRIINFSVYDDYEMPWRESPVSLAVEAAFAAGICVVAAVGNDPNAPIRPPANSPGVIAVGGTNDQRTRDHKDDTLYHSTFGQTVDGLQKPDIIAPAIWIAAPILPKTKDAKEADILFELFQTGDSKLMKLLRREISNTGLPESLLNENNPEIIRGTIRQRIEQLQLISEYYKHVDGTSFAAPIVCSIIAQMLEANPDLTPPLVREILLQTARRLPGRDVRRQGYGVVNPKAAVALAIEESHEHNHGILNSPQLGPNGDTIVFFFHDHNARRLNVGASFNEWQWETAPMIPQGDGNWRFEIPILPSGKYTYKYVIDGEHWKPDPRNGYREPDGFNGLNSVFWIP